MTRVRWSESEQDEVVVRDDAAIYMELESSGVAQETCTFVDGRRAERQYVMYGPAFQGPMESDTSWHWIPNHNPDPRASPGFYKRVTSIFVGSTYRGEWAASWCWGERGAPS